MQQIIWTLKKYILAETKRPILWKNITPLGVFLIWIITHLATSESINKQWTMWTVVYFNQLSGAIAGQNLFLSSFLHVFASFYAKMAKNHIIPICWLTKKCQKTGENMCSDLFVSEDMFPPVCHDFLYLKTSFHQLSEVLDQRFYGNQPLKMRQETHNFGSFFIIFVPNLAKWAKNMENGVVPEHWSKYTTVDT